LKMKFIDFFQNDMKEPIEAAIRVSCSQSESKQEENSIYIGKLSTLTLYGNEEFPVYKEFEWFVVSMGANELLFSGRRTRKLRHSMTGSALTESELVDFFVNAPIALHWLSGTGLIVWANKKELDTLGYTADEYIGRNVMEFCPDEKERVLETFSLLGSNATIQNVPFKFRSKSGDLKYFIIDSNVSYHQDGTFKHTRCFIRDDTERQIHEMTVALEKKLSETNATMKDAFIRRVFHELRTPLQAMQIALDDSSINTTAVSILQGQVDALTNMMDNFIYATYFNKGQLLRLCPLKTCLRTLVKSLFEEVVKDETSNNNNPISEELLSIVISTKTPSTVLVDQDLLRRVLGSLLSNAVKHSIRGTKIVVSIMFEPVEAKTGEGTYTFSVRNQTEKPLDPTKVQWHFQKMFQDAPSFKFKVENKERNYTTSDLAGKEGLGLGLFIAFSAAQNLGSLLQFHQTDEDEPVGSSCEVRFMFSLQLKHFESEPFFPSKSGKFVSAERMAAAAKHRSNSWVAAADSPLANMHIIESEDQQNSNQDWRIGTGDQKACVSKLAGVVTNVLVVDDSPICQKVVSKMLEKHHFKVTCCGGGEEALELLSIEPRLFSACVMDLRMPVVDGITATRRARENLRLSIPILVLSAEVGEDIKREAIAAGANTFVSKPCKSDVLLSELTTLLLNRDTPKNRGK